MPDWDEICQGGFLQPKWIYQPSIIFVNLGINILIFLK